jgi:hypothetical protein
MNSKDLLYKKTGNDEAYTPKYGVLPILKFIPKDAVVWCPFDTNASEYVKEISKTNSVVYSHIENGKDFFKYQPKNWDVIVSNPPFKGKRQFFERALSFGKPFALLMTNTWLNDKYSKWVFKETNREMQLLMFDKRIEFFRRDVECGKQNRPTFSSSYFCSDFLPKQIILEELKI